MHSTVVMFDAHVRECVCVRSGRGVFSRLWPREDKGGARAGGDGLVGRGGRLDLAAAAAVVVR